MAADFGDTTLGYPTRRNGHGVSLLSGYLPPGSIASSSNDLA